MSAGRLVALAALSLVALVWAAPLIWMVAASFRTLPAGSLDHAALVAGAPTLEHVSDAWSQGDFARWYLNTFVVCAGILAVQLVGITMAGYAFARLEFPGRDVVFGLFLVQLTLAAPVLIVPNMITIVRLGLYDTLLGVMAPYFASAFGVFLMRQTFRAIPREFEEAARVDGASLLQLLRLVLVPLAAPGLLAFSIVSVATHWNEFLWPLMATDSPDVMVLTVGLTSFVRAAEQAADWGLVAAATLLVAGPLLLAFALFQRRFVDAFLFSGLK